MLLPWLNLLSDGVFIDFTKSISLFKVSSAANALLSGASFCEIALHSFSLQTPLQLGSSGFISHDNFAASTQFLFQF
jgi:hypothetical protein